MSNQTVVASAAGANRETRVFAKLSTARFLVFSAPGLWSFVTAFYDRVSLTPPAYFHQTAELALYFSVWLWLAGDRGRFPRAAEQYGGFAFFIFWPVLMPFYVVQTRGWRRSVTAFVFLLVFCGGLSLLGSIVGRLLLRLT